MWTKVDRYSNPSRGVVEEMCGIIKAPGYDNGELLRLQKVINEADVLPLHFVRILTQAAKLLWTHRGKLIPTSLGRRMLAAEQHGPLQALLFHVALSHMNLAYFDGYPLDSWPQSEVGVILWSLSASAHDWQPRETLTRLCGFPSRRSGVAMGLWLQRHGSPHSPTLGLVRAPGLTNRTEVGGGVGRSPLLPKSSPV
jgi:hypothetical protein